MSGAACGSHPGLAEALLDVPNPKTRQRLLSVPLVQSALADSKTARGIAYDERNMATSWLIFRKLV